MIYNKFFGFRGEPFGVTPDPRFLYMSKRHEDALAHLNFGISEDKGFVMLTGEVGAGKTTLIRYFLDNLGPDTHSSLIINPMVDPLELLKLINHDFGVACAGGSQKDQLEALNNFLLESFSRKEKAVLVIDEAQGLSLECLEFIRLLSNLETNTKKLLQVILVGQPELTKIVSSEPLRQLDQRIAVRYHLGPMDLSDCIIYINHRLKIAGGGMLTFPVNGIKLIYRYSRGIPRLINLTCDRTLLLSYSDGKVKIGADIIKKAIRELSAYQYKEKTNFLKYAVIGIAIVILVITAYRNVSHEDPYLDKISNILKGVRTEGEFFINDGTYMVSKAELSESACILNLLNVWGEKDLRGDVDISGEPEKRGYSVYRFNDLDKAIRLNMPCVLSITRDKTNSCVVLRWVVGGDAMLIDPRDGKNILPIKTFKDTIAEISIFYKNRYNKNDRISLLQQELKKRGLYNSPVTGELGLKTKKALMKFQEIKGLEQTGTLDEETTIMLSADESDPVLAPE